MDVVACGQRVGVSENESGGDMLEWGGGRIYAGAGSIREMDEGLGHLVVGDAAHLLRISTARQRSGRCTCNHSLFVGTDGIHHRLSPLALPERSRRLPSKPPSSPLDRASEV